MTRRVRALAAAATALVLAGAIGVFLAVRSASEPGHVRTVLAEAIHSKQNPCASVTDADRSPSAFARIPLGFARLAVERAAIICNYVGSDTYYFRFADHQSLETALRGYPGVRSQDLCALDHEVFTGDDMHFGAPPPGPFRSTCRRLGGQVLASAPTGANGKSPASRGPTSYPCRLTVSAPVLGHENGRERLLARGTVRCNRHVRGSVGIFVEGVSGPPGSGEEIGRVQFRRGQVSRQHTVVPCTGDGRATQIRVYSWILLTKSLSAGGITPSSLGPGKELAAEAYSRRVTPVC